MPKFNRKDAILIETEIEEAVPFDEDVLSDPTNGVYITISNPKKEDVISSSVMTKSATGKYYYKWQTLESYLAGIYILKITSDDFVYDGYNAQRTVELI